MTLAVKIEKLRKKRIGISTVKDTYLNKLIFSQGFHAKCDYSGVVEETISIEDLASRVQTAFEHFLERTPEEPNDNQYNLNADRSSGATWERSGMPVVYAISGAARIPLKAAEDVQAILAYENSDFPNDGLAYETEFSSDAYYEEKRTYDAFWQFEWDKFEKSLKTEARFFNQSVEFHLKSIFRDIEKLQTDKGKPIVTIIGPKSGIKSLYRARAFQSDKKLIEALQAVDKFLGTPDTSEARAGRMNSKGISVFYGSTRRGTAISEVRPPVGSKVAVAKFHITRPLKVIDLDALEKLSFTGSIFDPEFAEDFPRLVFLSGLGQKLAASVMPDDEDVQYITTQAIADFLATRAHIEIDGLVYPSVQASKGKNIVLFHKAAKVEEVATVPESKTKATITEWTKHGMIPSYEIVEVKPLKTAAKKAEPHFSFRNTNIDLIEMMLKRDAREDTLRIQQDSIQIHHVEGVSYRTTSFEVKKWYETEIGDQKDE